MTKAILTEHEKQQISALVDGEATLSNVEMNSETAKTFERYALIGDVMRNKADPFIHLDIADSVSAALDKEADLVTLNPIGGASGLQDSQTNSEKTPNAEHPVEKDNIRRFPLWGKAASQMAIAASVAMVAIVGVQNIQSGVQVSPQELPAEPLPILHTRPFGGVAAPVSLASERNALENAQKDIRQLQQQRLGALVMEHQRQLRLTAQATNNENNKAEQDESEFKK